MKLLRYVAYAALAWTLSVAGLAVYHRVRHPRVPRGRVADHQLCAGEYVAVRIGGHVVLVSNDGGDPHLCVDGHATVRVEGGFQDHPLVVVGEGRLPTRYLHLSTEEFRERYENGGWL